MPINDDLHHILLRRKAEAQGKTGRLAHARVFSRPDGPPWSKWCVENHFTKALAAADIQKPLIFHDLRHTSASRMKRNGIGETEIQRVLGHNTLSMTDRHINVEIE
jgi:integrase